MIASTFWGAIMFLAIPTPIVRAEGWRKDKKKQEMSVEPAGGGDGCVWPGSLPSPPLLLLLLDSHPTNQPFPLPPLFRRGVNGPQGDNLRRHPLPPPPPPLSQGGDSAEGKGREGKRRFGAYSSSGKCCSVLYSGSVFLLLPSFSSLRSCTLEIKINMYFEEDRADVFTLAESDKKNDSYAKFYYFRTFPRLEYRFTNSNEFRERGVLGNDNFGPN